MAYTVIDSHSGEAVATGLTVADAAAHVLTADSQEYDIRPFANGGGFQLWTRKQVANKGWSTSLSIFSVESDRDKAEAEIFKLVVGIDANWSGYEVMTDEQYAEMMSA
jgi:hypothetical protein